MSQIGFTHHEGHEEHEGRSYNYPNPSCPSYYYTSKFARLAQICGERRLSNSEIYPAKAQRREVRRGKSNILTNYFHYFFRPLRP